LFELWTKPRANVSPVLKCLLRRSFAVGAAVPPRTQPGTAIKGMPLSAANSAPFVEVRDFEEEKPLD
jgi:hypothetical protein